MRYDHKPGHLVYLPYMASSSLDLSGPELFTGGIFVIGCPSPAALPWKKGDASKDRRESIEKERRGSHELWGWKQQERNVVKPSPIIRYERGEIGSRRKGNNRLPPYLDPIDKV